MGIFLTITIVFILLSSIFILAIVYINEKEKRELVQENSNLIKRIEDLEISFRDRLNFEIENYKKKDRKILEEEIRRKVEEELEEKFEDWKKEKEKEIIEKVIQDYGMYILKTLSEKFAPFYIMFKYEIDPRDIRFLGCPVDYVAFKGLEEKDFDNLEILFIKVKSDERELSEKEKAIKNAIENKRVKWLAIDSEKFLKENIKIDEFFQNEIKKQKEEENNSNG
jgi:predicted Holliday junction resolvase-like endonuclease